MSALLGGDRAAPSRRHLLILGAGTAGTIVANKARRKLERGTWQITVVDTDDRHLYQPGLLFLPFGRYGATELTKPRHRLLAPGVELVVGEVDGVDADRSVVALADGRRFEYDYLIVASGTSPRPDRTPGMLGEQWRRSVFDFYTLDGALALREALRDWRGGRLVVQVIEMPIKCPVAPLEFAFLADAFLHGRNLRAGTDITYVTPLDGAFTKPVAAAHLGTMLDKRGIALEADFVTDFIDDDARELVSMDERRIPYDLLVTVPLNMGADYVAKSGLGDELNYVPVDKHTLAAHGHSNIFAIGDAADLPTSKAGSTAHFAADTVVANLLDRIDSRPLTREFDGHANCFIEAGNRKGLLIDFDYDTEPLPGHYPFAHLGPLPLLAESPLNHLGKLAFRWIYWHLLLPGRPLPLPARPTTAVAKPTH